MSRRTLLAGFVLAGAVSLLATAPAQATMVLQKKAKEAGIAATACTYCHADKLPKKGASALNDRGTWLQGQKDKRKAKEIDVAWLKDYVEKAK